MKRQPYDTDLADAEGEVIESLIPPARSGGKPRKYHMRQIVNAIFYVLRSGGTCPTTLRSGISQAIGTPDSVIQV